MTHPPLTRLLVILLLLMISDGFAQEQEISVGNVRIDKVRKDGPYRVRDEKGNQKSYETAYLVQMDLRGLPRALNTRFDFWIGEFRVREYGGTNSGVYFRLHELAKVRQLQGAEFQYSVRDQKPRPLGAVFTLPKGFESLPVRDEKALLRGADRREPILNVKVGNIRVDRVRRTGQPYVVRNAKGEKKTYETAYLVRMDVRGLPRNLSTRLDLLVGDFRIPEYGGTPTGLYFRLYEEQMEEAQGAELRYTIGRQPPRSLGAKLMMPKDLTSREAQEEKGLLGKE